LSAGCPARISSGSGPRPRSSARAEVEDLTGGGDHFRATVVSDAFDGLSRLEQHRVVYGIFEDQVAGAIHAPVDQDRAP
jgi:stress-induced morphogen